MTASPEFTSSPSPDDDAAVSSSSTGPADALSPSTPRRRRGSRRAPAGSAWPILNSARFANPVRFVNPVHEAMASTIALVSAQSSMQAIVEQTARAWQPAVQSVVAAAAANSATIALQHKTTALGLASAAGGSKLAQLDTGAQTARFVSSLVIPSVSTSKFGESLSALSAFHDQASQLSQAMSPLTRSVEIALAGAFPHQLAVAGMAKQMSAMIGAHNFAVPSVQQQLAGISALSPHILQFAETAGGQWQVITESLASVAALALQPWGTLQEMGERVVRSAVAFGQRAYFAVLAAQDAAIRGDVDAVKAFFRTWMELPRSGWPERVEAGMDVLVQTPVEEFGPDTAFELLEIVEKQTNHHFRRGRRLIGETELNHLRVASLEQLPARLGRPDDAPERFLPPSRSAEDRAFFVLNQVQDDRLEAVLGGLTPSEAQIAWAKGMTVMSWEDAAVLCGRPASEGERVRAKLTRRAKRMMAISSAPAPSFPR